MRWLVAMLVVLVVAPAAPAEAAVTPGWTALPDMPTGHAMGQAALLDNGKVLVVGGLETGNSDVSRAAELFDPVTNTWSRAASMIEERRDFAMAKLADGRVLVLGGVIPSNQTAEIYDPARNAWSVVGSPHLRRDGAALVALADGGALAVGGDSTAERFDPITHTWSAAMDIFPAAPRWTDAAALLPGNRVLVTGGVRVKTPGYENLADGMAFNGLGWSPVANMRVGRSDHRLVTLSDGRVLVVGGVADAGYQRSAEIYDASLNRWDDAGQMQTVRQPVAAVTLVNGSVMVVGGGDSQGNPLATAEQFVPATKTWAPAGTLVAPRYQHTATRLADGRVLVAGGTDQGFSKGLTSAEIWTPTATLASDPVLAVGDTALGGAGTATAQLTNAGDQPLLTESFALTGAQAGDFAVDASRCRVVAPRSTCAVDVRFTPSDLGARAATLAFAANTASGVHTVALSGRGVPAPLLKNLDRDGDGIPDATDRCASAAGKATRSGCPTGLLNDPSIRYQRLKRGIRVLAYYVKATTGARIVVTCSKHACKRGTAIGRGAKPVRIKTLNHRRLPNGTRITVTVSKRGRLTTTVYDRVLRARRSEGRPHCKPIAC